MKILYSKIQSKSFTDYLKSYHNFLAKGPRDQNWLGTLFEARDIKTVEELFSVLVEFNPDFEMHLEYDSEPYLKLLLAGGMGKLVGCSTLVLTDMFWVTQSLHLATNKSTSNPKEGDTDQTP